MRRNQHLLQKRSQFIKQYVSDNQHKQMKVIVDELV